MAWQGFIGSFDNDTLSKWLAPGLLESDLELNEDIELYQHCLDSDDRAWTIQEELNSRKYGI